MLACVIHGAKELKIENRPDPQPEECEVLVRFGAGGICGSDLHYYHEGRVGDFALREPMVLGHEVAGEIVEVGQKVTKIRVGQRVAVNPTRACLRCEYCLSGRSNLCRDVCFFGSAARFPHVQGAFAELFIASELQCIPIPESMSYRVAACAEPFAVTLHAVARAGNLLGRRVLVTGSGPIGVLVVAAARLAGAAQIVVTDLFDEPLRIAEQMGATQVVNVKAASSEFEVFKRFKELSHGKTAVLISHRFSSVRMADRIVVISDGAVEAVGTHAELLERGGRYAELFELQAAGYR